MTTKRTFLALLLAAVAAAGVGIAQESRDGRAEMRIAQRAMADRDYPAATRALTTLIDRLGTGEKVEEAYVLLLRARIGVADFEGALEAGRRYLGAFPGSDRARKVRSLMADAWVRMRDFRDASRIYREKADFLSGDVHLGKVSGYYLELARQAYEGEEQPDEFGRPQLVKDFKNALAWYRKAREIHLSGERAPLVTHRIATCLSELGNPSGAVAEWKDLLEKWPQSDLVAEAKYRIGEALRVLRDPMQARKFYREVLDDHRDTEWAPLALVSLGATYEPATASEGDALDRGLAYWRDFLRLHPSHEDAEMVAYLTGWSLDEFGRLDAAIEAYRTYLEMFPETERSPAAKDRIAWCYYRKAEFDLAIREWKEFLGRWPNDELWTKVQEAIANAAFAKGRHPYDLWEAADVSEKPKLLDRAEEGFRAFLAEYPVGGRAPDAQYLIAEIDLRRDDFAGAIAEWRITASKYAESPLAPMALFRIGRTQAEKLGDLGTAIATWEELVERFPGTDPAGGARAILEGVRKKHLEVVTERVQRTDEEPVLHVRTRNIEHLKIRAWPVNLEDRFRRKRTLAEMEKVAVEILVPAWEETVRTSEFEKYRMFERDVPLGLAGPGAWIVTVQDEDLTATTLVVVSDLTIITKAAPGQALVFAVNERTQKPVPGARVLLGRGGRVVAEGRTDGEGVWLQDRSRDGGESQFFAEIDGHVAFTDLPAAGGTSFGYSTKAYLYTDRPLYRPGQTAKVKGIYRRVQDGVYSPSANEPLSLEIRDPRDTVIHREDVTTNDYGTFAAEVWLPGTAALGSYRIRVTDRAKRTFAGTFDVEEFRKPEFTITTKTGRRTYLPGETVETEVALRYFFGGPVPGTTVRYTIYRGPFAFDPSEHDEFAWFTKDPERERERERIRAAGMEPVSSGELRTDADGNAELSFPAEDIDADARYVIAFEALDLNREWVRESAAVIVARQGFYALARTEKKVYRPGEEIRVELTTVDALHYPLPAEGELVVARRTVADGREFEDVVSRTDAVTGDDGKATTEVTVGRAGEYRLRFVAKDRAGNRVSGFATVTIAGEAEDLMKQAKVVASRQIYREGEEAEVLVNSPVAPAWALLTFEGERVLDHRVIRLTERSTTLKLPMKPEYAPNVFLRVALSHDHELHEAGDEVWVFRYLEVSVTPDREEAKPGETVSYTVSATDQRGQPVSAEVSLAVIDRSILALRPDGTPQMKPFFYDQRRTLAVKTGSSHSFKYHGDTRPTNKDVLWEELRKQGPEKFNRTMRYVQGGKEFMARGDLENAAIEFRKALQVSPMNYEARELLARVETEVQLKRQLEELKRYADKLGEDRREVEREKAAGRRPNSTGMPAPSPAKPGMPADRRGWGSDAPAQEPAESADADDYARDAENLGKNLRRLERTRREAAKKELGSLDFAGGAPELANKAVVGYLFQEAVVPARLRQTFADTAAFEPRVVTGADGKATVEVHLPDNLTTWRAVARGVTKDTLVGETTADVTARKDLLVRIDAPRFLTQKDRATITGTVHNNLAEEVGVRVSLTGANIGVEGRGSLDDRLRPRQIRAYDFTLGATDAGLAELTARAETTVESDAALAGLPVVPHGLRTIDGRSAVLSEEAVFDVELPDGIVPGTRNLTLTLSPGIDGSILESLVYLDTFPYGCLEQTVNRFLPAIAARRALVEIGSSNAKLKSALDRAVTRGLLALYSFQNGDGSFGWFGGDVIRRDEDRRAAAKPGDPIMTAFAILGMRRAQIAGFDVSESHRIRALAAGRRLVKEAGSNSEKAFLLHALALAGAAELEDLNQVYRYRDGLDAFSLAALSLAMRDTDRAHNAFALTNLLAPKAVRTGGTAHWEGDGRFNDVETTAYAVRALLAAEPQSDLAAAGVRWLLTTKRGPRWTSTRDTGAAVLALADWLLAKGVARSDYVVEVWLNDGSVPYQKLRVAGGKVADDQGRTVIVDGARLRTGGNRIRLVKRGPGECFVSMFLTYVTEAEDIEADGNLVTLERRYTEYVSPLAAKEGKKEIEPGWSIVRPDARPKQEEGVTIERAGTGDKFRVRIRIEAREDLSYVILEDPLPAGVEVVEGQAKGPFDWEERRDTKQVFFLTDVPKGESEVSYLVQAIHPGSYHALPAAAWPMYEPEIHGRSAENRLTVLPESGVVGRSAMPEGVTPDEIYGFAVRDFAEKRFEKARSALETLLADFRLLDEYQAECQAMLMRANFELGDHRKAVVAYERLVELNPRRGPKDREERRKLAVAYHEIGEFERALSLFKGVVDEHFALELEVEETYRGLGQPLEAQAFAERLFASYPDSNAVVEASWRTALRYLDLKRPEARDAPEIPGAIDAGLMLPEALDAFRAFLANHPESTLADEANRMIVSVLNRMEVFDVAVEEAERFLTRHPASIYLDDVTWYLTESFYNQREFEKVFSTGRELLTRKYRNDVSSRKLTESPFVPHVKYLFAKTHHHRGELAEAVKLYEEVKGWFEDARDALAFLTRRELRIPETISFGIGDGAELPVERKNLTDLELRVYPVDLMLLVAVKKDLRTANDIDLTGIAPTFTVRKEWKDGEDFRWHEGTVPIRGADGPLGKGAYLVVARSGGEATSSLVLVSDLEVSLQVIGDKVRVYAVDRNTRAPKAGVFVKVSDGREIKAQGFTDARGVFEGRGISGAVTVVAETEKDGHYALIRR